MKNVGPLVLWLCGFAALAVADDVNLGDFVNLQKIDVTIRLDIRYATKDNFTKKVVYPEAKCVLRRPVAEALARVQNSLKLQGMGLKMFDCYRPLSVQKIFWALVPDERYVADPKKGSKHNRGAAVDLTLVDNAGNEMEMPSQYDDFSEKAHRTYKGATKKAKKNSKRLEAIMVKEGFLPIPNEWWHYDYKGWEKYEIADVPFSAFK